MSISCEEVMSALYAYLDKELDAPTENEINKHLSECRECFSRAEFEWLLRKRHSGVGSPTIVGTVKSRLDSLVKRF